MNHDDTSWDKETDQEWDGELALDRLCDRFEQAWKQSPSQPPSLADFVGMVSETQRAGLARELIQIDRDYRRTHHCELDEDDYGRQLQPLDLDPNEPQATQAEMATLDSAHPDANRSMPKQGERIRYFGDYEIISEIARGGMGVVYRARQISLNREIALKMILSGNIAGEDQIRRFQIEAESAAGLDHPGIVPIYDIGNFDGQHYFSMKLIEGESLSEVGAKIGQDLTRIVDVVAKTASAVHHAHQRGILHRDLKPANVLIDADGDPVVTDFGLARSTEHDHGITQTGAVMGTPGFMSPEQATGGGVTTATDVYSLGAILYQLLCGRPPHQKDSVLETLRSVVDETPPPPRGFNADVHADLELICLHCLAKDPRHRYENAADLATDLRAFEAGQPLMVRPPSVIEMMRSWLSKNFGNVIWIPVIATVVGVLFGGLIWAGTIGSDYASRLDTYDKFAPGDRPWLAKDYSFLRPISIPLMLLLTTTIGWATARLVKTKNRLADVSAGLGVGLLAGLLAFVSGFGPAFVRGMTAGPREDFGVITGLAVPEGNTERKVRQFLQEKYPTLRGVPTSELPTLLYMKADGDTEAAIMTGTVLGTCVSLIIFTILGVTQTWVAGRLIRNETPWRSRISYMCFTIVLVCVLFLLGSNFATWISIGSGYIIHWLIPAFFLAASAVALMAVHRKSPLFIQGLSTIVAIGLFGGFMSTTWMKIPPPVIAGRIAAIKKAKSRIAKSENLRDDWILLTRAHATYGSILGQIGDFDAGVEHLKLAATAIEEAGTHSADEYTIVPDKGIAEIKNQLLETLVNLGNRSARYDVSVDAMNEMTRTWLVEDFENDLKIRNGYIKLLGQADRVDQLIAFAHRFHLDEDRPGDRETRNKIQFFLRYANRGRLEVENNQTDWLSQAAQKYADSVDGWTDAQKQTYVNGVIETQSFLIYGPIATSPEMSVREQLDMSTEIEKALLDPSLEAFPEPDLSSNDLAGRYIDFKERLSESENQIAYAATTIHLETAQKIRFTMASDDGAKVWIDSKLVLENASNRHLSANRKTFDVDLIAGSHRMLLKISQAARDWGFWIGAMDDNEFPIEIWETE
ncbi:Serine/threonine-protein kinase PrkC [Rubripirellula tenax]|uniref:non-specific serine/threonine protein kinase n=1 Tax=Rubripirellula tenax TaxID=2528015 RepID=A0A5C6ELS6_9BACT|nr:protein kinase [Rubripirellula tenax]TWU48566.1 Serine/threonine-protein kinase PrkC [Rubripirellula tenax]